MYDHKEKSKEKKEHYRQLKKDKLEQSQEKAKIDRKLR